MTFILRNLRIGCLRNQNEKQLNVKNEEKKVLFTTCLLNYTLSTSAAIRRFEICALLGFYAE
jgi:hypothetical protein